MCKIGSPVPKLGRVPHIQRFSVSRENTPPIYVMSRIIDICKISFRAKVGHDLFEITAKSAQFRFFTFLLGYTTRLLANRKDSISDLFWIGFQRLTQNRKRRENSARCIRNRSKSVPISFLHFCWDGHADAQRLQHDNYLVTFTQTGKRCAMRNLPLHLDGLMPTARDKFNPVKFSVPNLLGSDAATSALYRTPYNLVQKRPLPRPQSSFSVAYLDLVTSGTMRPLWLNERWIYKACESSRSFTA